VHERERPTEQTRLTVGPTERPSLLPSPSRTLDSNIGELLLTRTHIHKHTHTGASSLLLRCRRPLLLLLRIIRLVLFGFSFAATTQHNLIHEQRSDYCASKRATTNGQVVGGGTAIYRYSRYYRAIVCR